MDVMPDCAPAILGLVTGDDDEKWENPKRRWKAQRDFGVSGEMQEQALGEWRAGLQSNDGQSVTTFVADLWTLEYDLAFCGLAEEVYVAASLAKNDDPLNKERKQRTDVETVAREEFKEMEKDEMEKDAGGAHAALCSRIYKIFHSRAASKAIAAQYLAETLAEWSEQTAFDRAAFAKKLPRYIVEAIAHVKRADSRPSPPAPAKEDGNA